MKTEFIKKIKETKNVYFIKDILTIFLKKEVFLNKMFKNILPLGFKQEDEKNINQKINSLKKNDNIFFDNNAKDIYYKTRSIGCTYCTMGTGCTVVLSYKCHRDCFFCYEETPLDPKVKIDPYNKEDMDKIYSKIDTTFSNPNNKTLAVTGGEPFLFTDKVYEILEYVNKKHPGKHTRIYTSGDMMKEETLIQLKKLGLNELRYSIKPYEEPNINTYKLSKKYIETVMIEMPVQPDSKDYMIDILTKIDESNCVDGINLNELTFNNVNAHKFKEEGYKLDLSNDKRKVYHKYYDIKKIEIGVFGSKIICLELLDYFSKKNASFFMHYCDLDTVSKHHYIHKKQKAEAIKLPYTQINEFGLHKILRIYSKLDKVLELLKENNIVNYYYSNNFIEIGVDNLSLFKDKGFILVIIYKNFDYKYDVDFEIVNI